MIFLSQSFRMPYLLGSIPLKIFYSSFGAEILGIARKTNTSDASKASFKLLISRLKKQDSKPKEILKIYNKMFGQRF